MKVFKLEVIIIDEGINCIENAIHILNQTRYPNHTNVRAYSCREADIGEWDDDNPLNNRQTEKQEIDRLFPNGGK